MSEPPHVAPLDDVAKYAESLKDEYLTCRVKPHQWNPVSSTVTRLDGKLYESIECSSCTAVNTQIIDASTGEWLAGRSTYPKGYLRKGQGRLPKAGRGVLRLERYRRMKVL